MALHPGYGTSKTSYGTTLLDFFGFRELSRFHCRKCPFLFLKALGEADWCGPQKNQKHSKIFHSFQNIFDLVGCAYVSRFSDFPNFLCSKIFRFPKLIKIPPSQNSIFVERYGRSKLFWATRIWKSTNSFQKLGTFRVLRCWDMKIFFKYDPILFWSIST